jgi:hypothetical protein
MRKAILTTALFLTAFLTACSGAKPAGEHELKFGALAPDVFTVVIDPHADVATTEAAIRKHCAARPVCTVLGWTDAGAVARTYPITDRDMQALAVRYDENEPAGLDEAMWDCVRFPAAKAPCLPKA